MLSQIDMKRTLRNVRSDSAMDKRIYANIDFAVDRPCVASHVSDGAGGRALLYPAREQSLRALGHHGYPQAKEQSDVQKPRAKSRPDVLLVRKKLGTVAVNACF